MKPSAIWYVFLLAAGVWSMASTSIDHWPLVLDYKCAHCPVGKTVSVSRPVGYPALLMCNTALLDDKKCQLVHESVVLD
ncbi:hypothetical protein PtB15_12B225 [Puccinia triticina]|nr:hypothetical protein PtB15_12B225 [Puccinia triticina]